MLVGTGKDLGTKKMISKLQLKTVYVTRKGSFINNCLKEIFKIVITKEADYSAVFIGPKPIAVGSLKNVQCNALHASRMKSRNV